MSAPRIIGTKYLTKAPTPKGQNLKSLKNTAHLKGFMLFLNPEFREKVNNIRKKFETAN